YIISSSPRSVEGSIPFSEPERGGIVKKRGAVAPLPLLVSKVSLHGLGLLRRQVPGGTVHLPEFQVAVPDGPPEPNPRILRIDVKLLANALERNPLVSHPSNGSLFLR